MSKNNKNIIFTIIICVSLLAIFWIDKNDKGSNIEEKDVHVGIGYSIKNKDDEGFIYKIPLSVYIFKENGSIKSTVHTGIAEDIGQTREDRQNKSGRSITFGFEKAVIFDEEFCEYGLGNVLNILFKNSMFNEDVTCVVCRGNSIDYLSLKVPGYNSSSDYIDDMIKSQQDFNFFGKNYKVRDLFLTVDSEGRNAVLPYIEIVKNNIELKGMALFKKDKIVDVINIQDTRIMNMLRERSTKGILTIEKNSKEYINMYAVTKKKAKCKMVGDKYQFTIEIDIKGDVISNTLYNGMPKDLKVVKKFENDMEEKIQKDANAFLRNMKELYRVDCLELGRIAAAKYGRGTGIDWNEIICNSDIQVNANVHLDKVGRGYY